MEEEQHLQQPLLLRDHESAEEGKSSSPVSFDWLGRPASSHCSKLGGKRTMFFTTGCLCLWQMASHGIFFNLVLFLRDVFGFGSGNAASETANVLGSSFFASLLGALVAESFLGRLWTCALSQSIAMMGMALMMIATKVVLSPGKTTGGVQVFFFFSIYLLSTGFGAFQSTLQSLAADQFDMEGDKAALFTCYLVMNNMGLFLADTLIVYVASSMGWLIGFGLSTSLGAAGLILFAFGIPFCRQYWHKGNPYQRALQVLVGAARKWRVTLPTNSDDLYEEEQLSNGGKLLVGHTGSVRCLDKAAVLTPSDINESGKRNVWMLSTVTEVEEMKAVLRLVPLWASTILFYTIYAQPSALLVEEGALMNTKFAGGFTMEPAAMNFFNILMVVVAAPFYNAIVVPLVRRITGHPRGLSSLHRMGAGYVVSIIAVSIAAVLENYRFRCYEKGLPSPSIFWQAPELILLGFSQFLTGIGQLEFFYTHMPVSLRSLGSSFGLTCVAFGNYVSSFLIWIVTLVSTSGGQAGWLPQELNDGHLDYFLWLLAGLELLSFLWFLTCAKSLIHQHS